MNTQTATEYRNLPLSVLTESKTNPRRTFEDGALMELADSISANGIIQPLLVRPVTETDFEVVVGARRFRAAKMAGKLDVSCRVAILTDAEVLEIQLVENLQRRDVHPMEEAQGFRALLGLDEPKYSVEQIAAKTGKSPAYVTQRLKLTDLVACVVEAFYAEEIGVGHALLLAKLPGSQQEKALAECFEEQWAGAGQKAKRILLPVRHLQQWIERQLMLILKLAPFSRKDAQLVPDAGSCLDCPKRTGHNRLLFAEVQQDACTDPACYALKVEAHVKAALSSKPKLVQISTSYGQSQEGQTAIPRHKYVEIATDTPDTAEKAKRPEYKTCRFTSEAIVTQGSSKGELRKVCANPECPIHRAKRQPAKADASFKAEQEKQRRETAVANATGHRLLAAIVSAVPVRLMKRDLLFVVESLLPLLDEPRQAMIARNRGIRAKEGEAVARMLLSVLRKADESELGRAMVEIVILLAARSHSDGGKIVKAAAQSYKVDTDAIALKVKQEFAAKDKAKGATKPVAKPTAKASKKAA
jgi:ParB family transcriptional regulator, chromosome partitioning protein